MEESNKKILGILVIMVAISLSISGTNFYRISNMDSVQGGSNVKEVQQAQASDGNTNSKSVQQLKEEILPEEGSPTGYGIKFSNMGMKQMVQWYRNIDLTESEKQRYIKIGTTEGTSCEHCCGATRALRNNGQSVCGCEHNLALAGLIKYLVKNTDMNNQKILQEVTKWKRYFFPQQELKKAVKERGVSTGESNLPEMRGGC